MELDPENRPSLTHSKLLQARLDGKSITRPKWNGLLRDVHIFAFEKLGSFEELQKATSANIERGEHTDAGYHPIPEVGFSVQGIEANLAWEHTLRLAKAIDVSLEVTLEWRKKDGADYPGQRGSMTWRPHE